MLIQKEVMTWLVIEERRILKRTLHIVIKVDRLFYLNKYDWMAQYLQAYREEVVGGVLCLMCCHPRGIYSQVVQTLKARTSHTIEFY